MSSVINQDISIGKNLKKLRLRSGLSQEEAAAKLQVMGFTISREIISQMERGQHNIRVSVLLALKQIYNSSFDDFFMDLSIWMKHTGHIITQADDSKKMILIMFILKYLPQQIICHIV